MFFTDTRKGNLRSCSGSNTMFPVKPPNFHHIAELTSHFPLLHIYTMGLFLFLWLVGFGFLGFPSNLLVWFVPSPNILFLIYLCHVKLGDSLSRFFIVSVNDCPLCSGGSLHGHFWKVCWCFCFCCADLWSKTENGVVIFQVVIKCWVFCVVSSSQHSKWHLH